MATANFAAINEDFCDRGVLRWLTFDDGPHGYALGLCELQTGTRRPV